MVVENIILKIKGYSFVTSRLKEQNKGRQVCKVFVK